ncbi:MAG: alpha/beta fold hydrolase, partial [Solirubrobacterales bacterium]
MAAQATGGIETGSVEVDGIGIFFCRRGGEGPPAVFVHGNPTSSLDWVPFMERLEGPAVAFDLPGFGRSERPDPDRFDHGLGAYADFTEALLAELAPGGYSLVVHDWGGLALAAAQRDPERVRRLVVMNAVPLNGSYRWHWIARIWRRRGLGELFNATNSRFATAQLLRLARPGRRPMPAATVDDVWASWDAGMRRAVLGLYRSADPPALALAG